MVDITLTMHRWLCVVYWRHKHRVADVVIHWQDNSTDEFVLPYRADAWVFWTPTEVDQLRQVVEACASQVEIASSVPTHN